MTPVLFRKFNKGQDVIAIFPTIAADLRFNAQSYQHIGQHGACSPDLLHNVTTKATREEYGPLLAELRSIGYNDLKVVDRRTAKMRRELVDSLD